MTAKTWGTVGAIVTAIVGAGGTSSYVISQVADVKNEQAEVKKELERDRRAGWQTQQDVEVIKERLKRIDADSQEIKSDVKELLRRSR